jgi:hypothetical protein
MSWIFLCPHVPFLPVNDGVVAFTDPTLGTLTCYDVLYGSYVDGSIANETCSLVQELAAETCCVASGPYSECLICGDGGIVLPDATFFDEGYPIPCDYLGYVAEGGYLNETVCAYITPLVGPSCCAASIIPSAAPV